MNIKNEKLENDNITRIMEDTRYTNETQKYYSIGWSRKYQLIDNDKKYIYEFQATDADFVKVEVNKKNFVMKLFRTAIKDTWLESEDYLFSTATIDLSSKGDRWEGSCLDGVPYGYGCLFDEFNNLIYKGYMIDGKKVCFGEDYYDNGVLHYCGTFMDNYRHGYGSMYDKRGDLLYEGEWAFDQNDTLDITVSNDCMDDGMIHNMVDELVIGDDCYNNLKELIISNYPNLTIVRVGSRSFQDVEIFELFDCEQLELLVFGDESMQMAESLELKSRRMKLILRLKIFLL